MQRLPLIPCPWHLQDRPRSPQWSKKGLSPQLGQQGLREGDNTQVIHWQARPADQEETHLPTCCLC